MLIEVPLQVESATTVGGRPCVLARLLGPAGDFVVNRDSTLQGAPLEEFLDAPRKVDAHGEPRLDVFAFRLRHARDLDRFTPGARVVLRTTSPAPGRGRA
jgi:hypothetical protein